MRLLATGGFFLVVCCGAAFALSRELGFEASPLNNAYVSSYEIVNTFEHSPDAFTQGLTFDEAGNLYESDGLYGKSAVRQIDVLSGKTLAKTSNERAHFGEGLQVVDGRMFQLTWKENVLHEYKVPSLERVKTHALPCSPHCKEGWGLAYDGESKLYLTDSTDKLFTLDAKTLQPIGSHRRIYDPFLGRAINGVNELEWVDGEVRHHSARRALRILSQTTRG